VSKQFLPLRFSDKNFVCISHFFHACYISHTSHPSRLNNPNNTGWKSWPFLYCHHVKLQNKILTLQTKHTLKENDLPGRGLASGVGVLSPVQDMSKKMVNSMKNVTSEWIPAMSCRGWYNGKKSRMPPGIPRIAVSTTHSSSFTVLCNATKI
jgi:hypothetical protein